MFRKELIKHHLGDLQQMVLLKGVNEGANER